MSKKNKWWLFASMAAMGAVTPAHAQDVSDEIVVTATGRAAAIQDVPLAVQAIPSEQLEQAGVQSIADLNQLAPTIRIGAGQSTTSGTLISIRGISTGSDNPGFEGAVGVFIDGVYRARAGAALGDLPDVERIEVLRGPQGTLFGKNTSAGALSVVTAGPSHDLGAWGEIEAAERGGARTSFGATTGLTDSLAVRFDGALRGQDGYIEDVTSDRDINDTDRWSGRAQALWDISPDASLRLIVDGGRTRENCCGAVNLQSGTTVGPLTDQFFGTGVLLTVSPEERQMTVSPNRSYAENSDDFGVSGQVDWAIGDINLTSITAYRNWNSDRSQDIDFSSIDRAYRDGLRIGINSASEEIRLQGESGRLNWLVGAFVSQENLKTTDVIRFGDDARYFMNAASSFITDQSVGIALRMYDTQDPGTGALCLLSLFAGTCLPDIQSGDGQQADHWTVETQSAALFTHNEFSLSDNLILTVGARFTHETKDMNADLLSRNHGCMSLQGDTSQGDPDNHAAALAAPTTASVLFSLACNPVTNTLANGEWSDEREENEWSGTASLAYHVTEDLMVYGGYSRGYKAGGFNLDRSGFFGAENRPAYAIAGDPILDSDGNPTGEVYGELTVDSLSFEPEFTDALELGLKSTIFGGTTYFNANVFYEQIHDYQNNAFSGFNFFTLNVPEIISRGVELEMNASPTDNLTLIGGVVYNEAYYDSSSTYGDQTIAEGTTLSQAPEWTVTGSANYRIPIGSHYVNLFGTARYVSDYTVQTLSRNPITDNDAFAIFDARISFGPEDERWSIEAFAKNLTDEYFNVGGFGAPERTLPSSLFGGDNQAAQEASNYLVYPNAPRTVGLMIRARY
jgi:iron complex outermembrane receptor protein